jgi:hypothetical protein
MGRISSGRRPTEVRVAAHQPCHQSKPPCTFPSSPALVRIAARNGCPLHDRMRGSPSGWRDIRAERTAQVGVPALH